jgi:hypothetical protein
MTIDSTSQSIARATKPEPATGSDETRNAMPLRATAQVQACDTEVCDVKQRMLELETHKLATLHLGSFWCQ